MYYHNTVFDYTTYDYPAAAADASPDPAGGGGEAAYAEEAAYYAADDNGGGGQEEAAAYYAEAGAGAAVNEGKLAGGDATWGYDDAAPAAVKLTPEQAERMMEYDYNLDTGAGESKS